jgi:hypothetical protein
LDALYQRCKRLTKIKLIKSEVNTAIKHFQWNNYLVKATIERSFKFIIYIFLKIIFFNENKRLSFAIILIIIILNWENKLNCWFNFNIKTNNCVSNCPLEHRKFWLMHLLNIEINLHQGRDIAGLYFMRKRSEVKAQ